jgi:hypothetical protein
MESAQSSVFTMLHTMWGLITVALIVLLSYRAALSVEVNQAFTDEDEQQRIQEKHELGLITERSRLTGGIIALTVLSGTLLLVNVGLTIYSRSVGNF